ncbi:hypothetical protein [Anaerosporobacter sp.]
MTYQELLDLFIKGEGVDETTFYFNNDEKKEEHYIGYLPQYEKPYWAGYCDIKDGCEFSSAKELFTAEIYDGQSIEQRWKQFVLTTIGGIPLDDL